MTYLKNFINIVFSIVLLTVPGLAGQPKPIDDPEKIAIELTEAIKNSDVDKLVKGVVSYTGAVEQTAALTGVLSFFKERTPMLSDKVFDQSFGDSLKQIVYYLPYKDYNFVYVRYNFKRIDSGWILANFTFKTEVQEIFPPDFVAGH